MYIENPKTKDSGIVCCIPQLGECPIGCEDCFFQNGRSYLEPLKDNLPNMPNPDDVIKNGSIVRVNDGNDSNISRRSTVASVQCYPLRFYNTSIPLDIGGFDAPVVLTLNPGKNTDFSFHKLPDPIPKNLMFVRFRINMWNLEIADEAINYYSSRNVPVILTFMGYFVTASSAIPPEHASDYVFRKRTTNSYWAITTDAWDRVMVKYLHNKWVHSCGRVEGEMGDTKCKFCGNCIREFYVAKARMALC